MHNLIFFCSELSELGNYKFAIDRPVDEKYSEHLVHCTDPGKIFIMLNQSFLFLLY